MSFLEYLSERYEYEEPIFLSELYKDLDLNQNTIRQKLKRLVDSGEINRYKYKDGIYFIPNPNSVLKNSTLNFNKVISKSYIFEQGERIGYITGLSLANQLQLTTQVPVNIELVTNKETQRKREVDYKIRKITLRKPRDKQVNNKNYKIFQVLDLLNDFEEISVDPIEVAIDKIYNYIKDVKISKEDFKQYLGAYPLKTQIRALENDIYNEITFR